VLVIDKQLSKDCPVNEKGTVSSGAGCVARGSVVADTSTNALIITDTASNVQRFIELVNALDKGPSRTEMKVYALQRAEAPAIADIISNLYKQIVPRAQLRWMANRVRSFSSDASLYDLLRKFGEDEIRDVNNVVDRVQADGL